MRLSLSTEEQWLPPLILAMALLCPRALQFYPRAIVWLRRWTYRLARRGKYDMALRLNRMWRYFPLYGNSLEGSILFSAGRYSDVLAFLKPLAFDEDGKPRLTSTALYTYALALVNSEHEAEAEVLLEAAVRVRQKPATMQVALATCLLTQNKEPERACKLMEQALAAPQSRISAYSQRADYARRIGRYAYALAACGRRQEAEARIQEAFNEAAGLNNSDLAGVHYFVGEARRSLSETAKHFRRQCRWHRRESPH